MSLERWAAECRAAALQHRALAAADPKMAGDCIKRALKAEARAEGYEAKLSIQKEV